MPFPRKKHHHFFLHGCSLDFVLNRFVQQLISPYSIVRRFEIDKQLLYLQDVFPGTFQMLNRDIGH